MTTMIATRKPGPFTGLRRRLAMRNQPRFEDSYILGELIEEGSQGSVFVATSKHNPQQKFAVKIIKRKNMSTFAKEAVLREVSIMRELTEAGVPNTNSMLAFFESSNKFYIVQELAVGGDVLHHVKNKGAYTENEARLLVTKILRTIQQLSQHNICHRDLKPDNLLLSDGSDNTSVWVADWGFATQMKEGELMKQRCGTLAYVAPEILAGLQYDQSVDLWSLGCILYLVLCRRAAFHHKDPKELKNMILLGEYQFYDKHNLSEEAKECIRGLLQTNPRKRWTAEQALNCAWLSNHDSVSGVLRQ